MEGINRGRWNEAKAHEVTFDDDVAQGLLLRDEEAIWKEEMHRADLTKRATGGGRDELVESAS